MILNQTLTFEDLKESQKNSFNGRRAQKVTIPVGTYFYKFTDWELFNLDKECKETISPFWGTMGDLADILAYAQKTGKTLLECVRARNAVLHNWNGLTCLIVIQTTQPIVGFAGDIGPQTEKGYAKEGQTYARHFTTRLNFWGGASQVCLPHLERQYIKEIVPPTTVYIRDDVKAIQAFLKDFKLI